MFKCLNFSINERSTDIVYWVSNWARRRATWSSHRNMCTWLYVTDSMLKAPRTPRRPPKSRLRSRSPMASPQAAWIHRHSRGFLHRSRQLDNWSMSTKTMAPWMAIMHPTVTWVISTPTLPMTTLTLDRMDFKCPTSCRSSTPPIVITTTWGA